MTITIDRERPDSPDAVQLITELDALLAPLYAVESRHGYSIQRLIEQQVEFFVIRVNQEAAGCGGVQWCPADRSGNGDLRRAIEGTGKGEIAAGESAYGELKRMYVRDRFRGLGLAKQLLKHFELVAGEKGIPCLRLETGIYQSAAIHLYERHGYYRIAPFGSYRVDPVSLCYEKWIGSGAARVAG